MSKIRPKLNSTDNSDVAKYAKTYPRKLPFASGSISEIHESKYPVKRSISEYTPMVKNTVDIAHAKADSAIS